MKLKFTCLSLLASAGLLVLPNLVQAQPSAHYVPGAEGLKAATLPPPGIWLRDYNIAYYATTLNDVQGNKIPGLDPRVLIYANVPRLIWITDLQLLGGNIGVDALVPLQYTSARIGGFDDRTFGIGDVFAEVSWSKHIQQFDFSVAYGPWAPTGNTAPPPTTRAGLGYWTHMFTAGATWYIDADKKWAVSVLNRYEINAEKEDTEITPGQAYTVEGGASYTLNKTLDLGIIGYYQQKVTEDSGPGASPLRDRVAGIGPEVGMFYPKHMLGWSLRYAYEFMAENRLQGHTLALTITKRF
jgi:hypothetical protein